MEHVKEAFNRAGYELITNDNYTEDWKAMWTFHNPFWQREPSVDLPAMMQKLKPHQTASPTPYHDPRPVLLGQPSTWSQSIQQQNRTC